MLHFVVPGRLDQITGGYLFDRRIVEGVRASGRAVAVIELPGRFPDADDRARAAAQRALEALPPGALVVIDGLALPAFEACLQDQHERLKLVGFIHHPLALETGLSEDAARHYAVLESRLWRLLHGFVCPSKATARALIEAGVPTARIAVTAPGTVVPSTPPLRTALPEVRLLCVGTVCERKGHAVLVRALAQLRESNWRLVCVGSLARSPDYAAALRLSIVASNLSERIALVGEQPPERLSAAYSDADAFVLPSFHEGYGMAYAEALAYGLPIVATHAGAIPDTVPADAALFVAPGDVSALAEALARLIGDAELRGRLAAGAARARNTLASWPEATGRWLAAIDGFAQ